jgi:hypothetical protein
MSESSQGGKFDSNLGGVAIRYGEVSGVIGVFDVPDTPLRIGMTFGAVRTAEGRALFRLQVPRADLPGRWVCLNRRFVLVEE